MKIWNYTTNFHAKIQRFFIPRKLITKKSHPPHSVFSRVFEGGFEDITLLLSVEGTKNGLVHSSEPNGQFSFAQSHVVGFNSFHIGIQKNLVVHDDSLSAFNYRILYGVVMLHDVAKHSIRIHR